MPSVILHYTQDCHWSEKSRGTLKKVREILNKSQGNLLIGQGTFEVLEGILFKRMTQCLLVVQDIISVSFVGFAVWGTC